MWSCGSGSQDSLESHPVAQLKDLYLHIFSCLHHVVTKPTPCVCHSSLWAKWSVEKFLRKKKTSGKSGTSTRPHLLFQIMENAHAKDSPEPTSAHLDFWGSQRMWRLTMYLGEVPRMSLLISRSKIHFARTRTKWFFQVKHCLEFWAKQTNKQTTLWNSHNPADMDPP